jgi:thioredoxin 1
MIIEATETNFDTEVLASEQPVLVDFWAEWCGPCRFVAPILDEIARERADELRLVKVNVDEQPGLAMRYGIQSIPTIVLFKDGEPAAATLGARHKRALEQELGLSEE